MLKYDADLELVRAGSEAETATFLSWDLEKLYFLAFFDFSRAGHNTEHYSILEPDSAVSLP